MMDAAVTENHFSVLLEASTEQLSVSLAVEASEGLNELYWQGIESSALADVADLPHESVERSRHNIDFSSKKSASSEQ